MTPTEGTLLQELPPLPSRPDDAHKGEVGRIVVIGGTSGEPTMIGAVALTANAALRSGAGLIQLLVPAEIRMATAALAPCATLRSLPKDGDALFNAVKDYDADVVVIGPGLGKSLSTVSFQRFVSKYAGPIVLDADGLNLLAEMGGPELPIPNRLVMTPHPGECRRLLGAHGRDEPIGPTGSLRRAAAQVLAELYRCTAVLKGAGTVVTDGRRVYVNETGNSGMATAGAGDVLTGTIAALIGQRMGLFEAAVLGVYLHGLAGDFAAEELGRRSLTAMDLIDFLPEAFVEHEALGSD